MSYDTYLFQLANGVSANEVNEFLNLMESRHLGESKVDDASPGHADDGAADENDEDDDDAPLLPERFVTPLSDEELRQVAGKAWLKLSVPEQERTEELCRFLESDETVIPAKWREWVDECLDYSGSHGMLPIFFSYSADMSGALGFVAKLLGELHPQRMAVYDPQLDRVLDATTPPAEFKRAAARANQFHGDVIEMITGRRPLAQPEGEPVALRPVTIKAKPFWDKALGWLLGRVSDRSKNGEDGQ